MLPSRPSARTLAHSVPAMNKVLRKLPNTPSLRAQRQSRNSVLHMRNLPHCRLAAYSVRALAKGGFVPFGRVFSSECVFKTFSRTNHLNRNRLKDKKQFGCTGVLVQSTKCRCFTHIQLTRILSYKTTNLVPRQNLYQLCRIVAQD